MLAAHWRQMQSIEQRRAGKRFQFFGHIENARLFRNNWIGQAMNAVGASVACRGNAMTLRWTWDAAADAGRRNCAPVRAQRAVLHQAVSHSSLTMPPPRLSSLGDDVGQSDS